MVLRMLKSFLLLLVSHAVCKVVLSTLAQQALVKTACLAKVLQNNLYLCDKVCSPPICLSPSH